MKLKLMKNNGSVFIMVIFVVALMAVFTSGMLQMTTEEIQLMRNQIYAAEALATAEAGLNDAFAELRTDRDWTDGFTDKAFNGGSYTVTVAGYSGSGSSDITVTSTATSSEEFVARVEADVTVSASSPYVVRIDAYRINE